jgi:hypothetical protein
MLVYSLREDMGSKLNYPPRHENERVGCALGSWDGRMFVMAYHFQPVGGTWWRILSKYEVHAHIPREMHARLVPNVC